MQEVTHVSQLVVGGRYRCEDRTDQSLKVRAKSFLNAAFRLPVNGQEFTLTMEPRPGRVSSRRVNGRLVTQVCLVPEDKRWEVHEVSELGVRGDQRDDDPWEGRITYRLDV